MSLDVYLVVDKCKCCGRKDVCYTANITHNLADMAEAATIYKPIWRPEEVSIVKAFQLIEPLRLGLRMLKDYPDRFKKYNSPNGWGTYYEFLPLVENYLKACEENPDATVEVSR